MDREQDRQDQDAGPGHSGLMPRVVSMAHGWWQGCVELGLPGYGWDGANANVLVSGDEHDPALGVPAVRSQLCRVYKADEPPLVWEPPYYGTTKPDHRPGGTAGRPTSVVRRGGAMTRRAIIADLDRCTGCLTCVVACKEENRLPAGMSFIRLVQVGPDGDFPELSMYYLPVACQQCARPACAAIMSGSCHRPRGEWGRGRGCREVHRLWRLRGGLPLRSHGLRSGDQRRPQVRVVRAVGARRAGAAVRGRVSRQGPPDRRRRPADRGGGRRRAANSLRPQAGCGHANPWAGSSSRDRSGATSARRRCARRPALGLGRLDLERGRDGRRALEHGPHRAQLLLGYGERP